MLQRQTPYTRSDTSNKNNKLVVMCYDIYAYAWLGSGSGLG